MFFCIVRCNVMYNSNMRDSPEVLWPEVVSPFRDAVAFVDRKQCYLVGTEPRQDFSNEGLGADVADPVPTGQHTV